MNKGVPGLKVVVGLGKTGFSVIRYLVMAGYQVVGVDNRSEPPLLERLRQEFPAVPLYLGGFARDILTQAEEIVLSPGVSRYEPTLSEVAQQGVRVIGDIELFARVVQAPVVAITGSNGKSTVTSLVGEMAQAAGKRVKVGGNLGVPVLDLVTPETKLYILELSSFQLETTFSLHPMVAAVLNVSPDHMDRYADFAAYIAAKQRIYLGSTAAVINCSEPLSYRGAPLPPKRIGFRVGEPQEQEFGIREGHLVQGSSKLLPLTALKLQGLHNAANSLAALALGSALALPRALMLKVLREFPGLPHRCQWVDTINGVTWLNDSKATNVGATKAALEGVGATSKGKIILLAGGMGKGADFTPLRSVVAQYVRTTVLIGKDAPLLAQSLGEQNKIVFAPTLAAAVQLCHAEAHPGDQVLLSPACASLDMFRNFEERGELFQQEVAKIKQ